MDLHKITELVVTIVSAISTIIIIIGVALAVFGFIKMFFTTHSAEDRGRAIRHIRVDLGSYILLSLEVLIAADIIETIAKPELLEIVRLLGIVVIRSSTAYFLNKEVAEMKKEALEKEDSN